MDPALLQESSSVVVLVLGLNYIGHIHIVKIHNFFLLLGEDQTKFTVMMSKELSCKFHDPRGRHTGNIQDLSGSIFQKTFLNQGSPCEIINIFVQA